MKDPEKLKEFSLDHLEGSGKIIEFSLSHWLLNIDIL